jgi:hypothetical protein
MAGAKGSKLAARALSGAPKKHYCRECKGSEEITPDMEMKPTMIFPGRRIVFKCKEGHEARKGGTLLQ